MDDRWAPAALAATSVLMLLPPPRARPGPPRWRQPAVLVVLAASAWLFRGHQPALAVVALVTATGARRLWRAHRAACERDRAAVGVRDFCEALAAELAAGAPPQRALAQAVAEAPELAAVATAVRLDADVPASLRALAERPGCHDLRLPAAAWQLAMRSGGGLADPLERAAAAVRARRRTAQVVAAELAPARATARLMAALPAVFLVAGSGLGGHPVRFLLDSTLGLGCLSLGLMLSWVGLTWLQHIADDVEHEP